MSLACPYLNFCIYAHLIVSLKAIVIIFSMMLFVRNKSTNFLPLVLGLFLKIGGANSRIISVFSKVGVCVTDKTVERVKLRLSEDAVQLAVDYIASGKLFYIIFDNINLYLSTLR